MATHQSEVPLPLAMKLASIVVHAQEIAAGRGFTFDLSTIKALAEDPEVVAWLETFADGLLPEKR